MIKLFCFILFQITIIKSQTIQNCTDNSFNITLISSDVDYSYLNITYSLKLSNNTQILNQTDYFMRCFKSVILKYKSLNSNENETITEIKYNGSLTSSIRFSNLTYFSSCYSF